jgi:hypothetical protein
MVTNSIIIIFTSYGQKWWIHLRSRRLYIASGEVFKNVMKILKRSYASYAVERKAISYMKIKGHIHIVFSSVNWSWFNGLINPQDSLQLPAGWVKLNVCNAALVVVDHVLWPGRSAQPPRNISWREEENIVTTYPAGSFAREATQSDEMQSFAVTTRPALRGRDWCLHSQVVHAA